MKDTTLRCNFSLCAISIPIVKQGLLRAVLYIESKTVIHEYEFDKIISLIKIGGIENIITLFLEGQDNVKEEREKRKQTT